jgi:hypothetical protein
MCLTSVIKTLFAGKQWLSSVPIGTACKQAVAHSLAKPVAHIYSNRTACKQAVAHNIF